MVPVGLRRTVAHFKPLLFSAQHTHTHTKRNTTALISDVVFGAALVFSVQSARGKCKLTAYLFKCVPLSCLC